MGSADESLNLATQLPAVILVAGLQGAGKTTSVAKLARYLIEREKKKVAVVSADVYRPAAIKQLETLAAEVGARFAASAGDDTGERATLDNATSPSTRLPMPSPPPVPPSSALPLAPDLTPDQLATKLVTTL